MNFIFQYIITQVTKNKIKSRRRAIPENPFDKEFKDTKVEFSHLVKDSALILLGIVSANIGLTGFLLPNAFIDGGVTGISLILTEITTIPLSYLLVAINIPFIIMGYSTIGKQFAIRSFIAILFLALSVHLVEIPIVTDDKLLIAVFGGFFLGLGIGLAIRGGAVIDGTEVLAIFVSKKTSLTIGDVILVFNILIFGAAAYTFSIEIALYAMLTYLSASKTVDFVVSGIEEYVGVTIISDYSEDIRLAIIEKMGRGYAWLDTGTHASLLDASNFVRTLTERQGLQVGSPDEVAYQSNWITKEQITARAKKFDKNGYGTYLRNLS